jgi:hypothetical protein
MRWNALLLSLIPFLPPQPLALAALGLAQSHASLFTPGNKVAFFLGVTQDPVPGHFFPKPPEQTFLRLS